MGIHEYQIVHGTPVALRYPLIRKNLRPMLLESEFSLFLNYLVGGLWLKERASCNRVFQIFYFPFEFCDIGIKCTSATQKAADFLKGIWTYLWHTCRNEYLPCGQLHIFHRLCRVYNTYTTGQLRIKTVFQNNDIQDSFHAFLFIFLFRVFIKSSKFNSWGVRNIQKSTWHSRSSFQHRDTYPRRCPCDEKTKHPFYSFFPIFDAP